MDYYRRQEFPQTYKRCKAYTEQFTDWLVKIATEREIERAQNYEQKPQNANNAHPTKKRKKHKIPFHDFVPLAKDVAASGVPLKDTSGLRDLSDAIRSRKEVTQWYQSQSKSDEEHPFFTATLVQVRDILRNFFTTGSKEHDVEDEPTEIIITIHEPTASTRVRMPRNHADVKLDVPDKDMDDDDEEDVLPDDDNTQSSEKDVSRNQEKPRQESKKIPTVTLSPQELEAEREFQVLCFMYDFNRLRQSVRQTWLDYKDKKINAMTAAQVTDIAQGVVQRDVGALIEGLDESPKPIADIVLSIYERVKRESMSSEKKSEIAEILCISSINHMKEYQLIRAAGENSPAAERSKKLLYIQFLLHFDHVRTKQIDPPVVDNFTRSMIISKMGSDPWLPFGFQIIMDVNEIVSKAAWPVFREISDDKMRLSNLFRDYCEYEDDMWKAGIKPEYMTVGETKFSDIFLKPAMQIVKWLEVVLEKDEAPKEDDTTFSTFDFVYLHSVLNGMVLYHFHKLYHSLGTVKTHWFLVALCHLYNACRQIGGLKTPWADMEFIITNQGTKRIFVGERPTDPQDFYNYLTLALAMSARNFHHERGTPGKPAKWIRPDPNTKAKRGFQTLLPFQQKVCDYFYNSKQEDRWIHLHNLFASIKNAPNMDPGQELLEFTEELQKEMSEINAASRPKKRKKRPPLRALDFESPSHESPDLLLGIKEQLREQELHSNFDYLSLYRRCFALVQEIRGEVLYDAKKQEIVKLDSQIEEPTNQQLLANLFHSLRIQPKDKNIEVKGDEVSKDVVAIEQLQRIAKIMGKLIKEEGRAELQKVEACLRRPWHALGRFRRKRDKTYPRGIYHRFTYEAILPRKRRVVLIRNPENIDKFERHSKRRYKGPFYRLVGRKKARIAFPCHGGCTLGRACGGRPPKPNMSLSALVQPRHTAEVWLWNGVDVRLVPINEEWEDVIEIKPEGVIGIKPGEVIEIKPEEVSTAVADSRSILWPPSSPSHLSKSMVKVILDNNHLANPENSDQGTAADEGPTILDRFRAFKESLTSETPFEPKLDHERSVFEKAKKLLSGDPTTQDSPPSVEPEVSPNVPDQDIPYDKGNEETNSKELRNDETPSSNDRSISDSERKRLVRLQRMWESTGPRAVVDEDYDEGPRATF